MNTRALTAALITFALAACTSTATVTPTPGPTASPAPTSTATAPATTPPTPTPAPSAVPTIEPTGPTIVPTVTPTLAPTATPTVEPTPVNAWTQPERIANGTFLETDVVVDGSGVVHVAAAGSGSGNRGIWYITNASGAWTVEQVSVPPHEDSGDEYDGQPSIALDGDGAVWIAFARWECWECAPNPPSGVWYATNAGGAWSDAQQIAGDLCGNPSLVVRDGIAHVAYEELGGWYFGKRNWPAWYGTNASGSWETTQVAKKGATPQLSIDAEGRAQILYFAPNDIRLVTQLADGSFGQDESLPDSSEGYNLDMAVDASNGTMWAGWSQSSEDRNHINVMVASRDGGGWSEPDLAIADADLTGLAVGQGIVNFTALVSDPAHWGGLVYAWNPDGPFAAEQLAPTGGDGSSVAIDPVGRAYVVYALDSPNSERGLWLLIHRVQ